MVRMEEDKPEVKEAPIPINQATKRKCIRHAQTLSLVPALLDNFPLINRSKWVLSMAIFGQFLITILLPVSINGQ